MRKLKARLCGYCGGLILVGYDRDVMGLPIRIDPRPVKTGDFWIIAGKAHPPQKGAQVKRWEFLRHDCSNPCPDFRSQFDNDLGVPTENPEPGF